MIILKQEQYDLYNIPLPDTIHHHSHIDYYRLPLRKHPKNRRKVPKVTAESTIPPQLPIHISMSIWYLLKCRPQLQLLSKPMPSTFLPPTLRTGLTSVNSYIPNLIMREWSPLEGKELGLSRQESIKKSTSTLLVLKRN